MTQKKTTRCKALASTVITCPNTGERIKIRMGTEFDCPNDQVKGLLGMKGIEKIDTKKQAAAENPAEPKKEDDDGKGTGKDDGKGGADGKGDGDNDPPKVWNADAFNAWVKAGNTGGASAFAESEEGRTDFNLWTDAGNEGGLPEYIAALVPGTGGQFVPEIK